MNMEKTKELFSDQSFVDTLVKQESPEAVLALLNEKGADCSIEEVLAMRKFLDKVESGEITMGQLEVWQRQAEDGELSEEALEQLSGGLGPISGAFVLACGAIVVFGGPPLVDYLTGGRW